MHWSTYLRALDRQEDSLRIHENGADIHRKLSETDPESTAQSLWFLAASFSTIGLHEDALSAAEKSVELYRKLTPTKPALTERLMKALGYRAKSLHALGREEDAARAEAEVATLKGAQTLSKESATVGFAETSAILPDAQSGSSEGARVL
ncbi:hypothetical protein DFH06DRAFT_1228139, partial [Mycena polygramma]